MKRFEAAVKAKGMTVFARIDHAAGGAAVGLSLGPTEVLIFGNAKAGTPLMQSIQTMGIDPPLKALVWQDGFGRTWLSYNSPSWLAKRHGLGHELDRTLSAMSGALDASGASGNHDCIGEWIHVGRKPRACNPLPRISAPFKRSNGDKIMGVITTRDGVEIFYKDWGQGQPLCSTTVGHSPATTGMPRCCSSCITGIAWWESTGAAMDARAR
jgi:uncharacterized protein (DUF302 family)